MKTIYLLFTLLAATFAAHAQGGEKKLTLGPTQAVINEDQGRACIVVGETLPTRQVVKTMFEPEQYSIFLGKGWATDTQRAKEPVLANLISNAPNTIGLDYFDRSGGKSQYSANNYEEKLIDVGTGGVVSDLQLQSVLSGIIKDSPVAVRGEDTIYVVYLEPSLTSTLGPIVGGKHYFAYHNAFNKSDIRVRYVVVPYEGALKTIKQRALIGFISAIFQPDCQP